MLPISTENKEELCQIKNVLSDILCNNNAYHLKIKSLCKIQRLYKTQGGLYKLEWNNSISKWFIERK